MLAWIKRMWLGSDPVEFESAFGLNESVERLKAVTRRWALFPTQETAAGTVSESRVSLQRVIPMVGNSFKPFFVGRFERRNSKVILAGRFTINRFVRIYLVFWFGFCAIFSAIGVVAAVLSPKSAPISFVGLGMLVFGFALTYVGNWLSRNDPAWLSGVIKDALDARITSSSANSTSLRLDRTPPASGTPWAVTKVSLLLALFGVMGCVSAATGIQTYRGGSYGSVITHYADIRMRYLAGFLGVVMLGLSYGIHRRRLTAWRLVFWVIGCLYVMQFVSFFMIDDLRVPRAVSIGFFALTAIIMIVWGRWWYAQRSHFHE